VAAVTASTASLNASALCAAGARKPLTLRTYCSAAACMSSSVTRSAYGARSVLMLLHMTRLYAAPRSRTGAATGGLPSVNLPLPGGCQQAPACRLRA
jgi:hypothetical protein